MNKYRDWTLPRLEGRVIQLARQHGYQGASKEERAAWLAGYDKDLAAALAQAQQLDDWQRETSQRSAQEEAERQKALPEQDDPS